MQGLGTGGVGQVFRGKSLTDGDLVYGNYHRGTSGTGQACHIIDEGWAMALVDPASLEVSTGQRDDKGELVFTSYQADEG